MADNFTSIHQKLVTELIPTYFKNLKMCKDLQEVKFSTRLAVKEITQLVFPEDFTPPVVPEYLVPNEEEAKEENIKLDFKQNLDICEEVDFAIKKFLFDQQIYLNKCN